MIGFRCRRCGSTDIRKNGWTATWHQKMHCKECDFYSTLDIQQSQRNAQYRQVERLSLERLSLERLSQRAMARITGLSRMTVAAILAPKPLPLIAETIRPLAQRPILEIDEQWSFVDNKGQEIWIWIALERQTRRIVGLAFGDRPSGVNHRPSKGELERSVGVFGMGVRRIRVRGGAARVPAQSPVCGFRRRACQRDD